MVTVPKRIRWALDILDPQPSDRLLEIGCGPGVAAAMVTERLTRGSLVAIDRSEVAVRRAIERNQSDIRTGKVAVYQSSFEGFDGRGAPFDKIFAINVNLFWVRDAAVELHTVKRLLKRSGSLFLFYETPGAAKAREIANRLTQTVPRAGFRFDVERDGSFFALIGSLPRG